MIFRFTIISDEVEDFMREIRIDADAKFLELHQLILESCGYKDDQMTSFTLCENGWEKSQEIYLEAIEQGSDQDVYTMEKTALRDFLEEEKQHLLYTFDPLADRVFFIELSEIITGKTRKQGKVSRSLGDAPQQTIDYDRLFNNSIKNSTSSDEDLEDDFFGSEISSEELDAEGLDITDGNPFE